MCRWKIAALLQAFGLSVGKWGLGNVLQCGWGFLSSFLREGEKNQINSLKFALTFQKNSLFFRLVANGQV
jgi:hypothetical protein